MQHNEINNEMIVKKKMKFRMSYHCHKTKK